MHVVFDSEKKTSLRPSTYSGAAPGLRSFRLTSLWRNAGIRAVVYFLDLPSDDWIDCTHAPTPARRERTK